jgi:UDP-2,3-diacylglucosamine pyrophosphatase LpxH
VKIRSLFISDVHLGTKKSRASVLLSVLKMYEFDRLVIVGDFLDLTSLKKKFYWHPDHSTVIQKILRLSRKGVTVQYIVGNHDHYLRELIRDQNIFLGEVEICDEVVHETLTGEQIFICHGDRFDGFIKVHPFLYALGDWSYELSFRVNRAYNFFRRLFGLKEWSLSAFLKSNVKGVIAFVNNFKALSVKVAKEKSCNSIMIGHTHTPLIDNFSDITYYNTGDFCETCSYLVEDTNGIISLRYASF